MHKKRRLPLNGKVHLVRLLPNAISVLALCAGLTAMRLAIEGAFGFAVTLMCVSAALDGIDGRLARLLKSESEIGAELDSLCDLVNFGVAPAFVLYLWVVPGEGSFTWIAALIFVTCCMLRLARFNVGNKSGDEDEKPKDFVGVPSPAGALLALGPIFVMKALELDAHAPTWTVSVWMLFVGALMISRLPTPSFKSTRVKTDLARFIIIAFVALVAALFTYPWITLLLVDVAYLLGIAFAWRKSAKALRNVV